VELKMFLAIIKGTLTGLAFGIVLYKIGATRYSRVMGMLTLRDTKVMKFTFMTIATASFIYGLASIFGIAENLHLVPRIMPFTGFANVLGGLIFGVTLGLVGFCPGTCVAKAGGQSGNKKFAAHSSILGLLTGILVYNLIKEPLVDFKIISLRQDPITLHGLLGLPYGVVALIWGALFILISILVDNYTSEKIFAPEKTISNVVDRLKGEWSWQFSGLIAGIIITLATAQDGYLGFSGALLALVGWASHLIGYPISLVPTITPEIAWRAFLIIGVFPGGVLAKSFSLKSYAEAHHPIKKVLHIQTLVKSFFGGLGLALGAMIGGGCTTGAYLAAWPTLSVGSLVMGGTFFAASMAVANLALLGKKLNIEEAQTTGDEVYD
jgi:hypothetical protein